MQTLERDHLVFIRMFADEVYYDCLAEACRKHRVSSGVILSSIGQLRDFELGYFVGAGDYSPDHYQEAHELVAVNGLISSWDGNHEFHLHATLGARDKRTISGHLISATVAITNETAILKSDAPLRRELDAATALRQLVIE